MGVSLERIFNLFREDTLTREFNSLIAQDQPRVDKHYYVARGYPICNRYSDVLPNEPTRVKFGQNQYFNANWVLDGDAIACQGPFPRQIADFWEMVDSTEVKTIISLANPVELGKAKCANFWRICSTSRDEDVLYEQDADFDDAPKIIRRPLRSPKGREVFQYHLQNWPDNGVVKAETLARLVEIVSEREGQILVHCSAGVGRTGTFLAAYEAFRTNSSDIFRIAKALRSPWTGRVGMIQNSSQYILIHDTVQRLFSKFSGPAKLGS